MKTLAELHCPECQSSETEPFKKYDTVHKGERRLLKCGECGDVFSETSGTPMRDIKSPISNVASAWGFARPVVFSEYIKIQSRHGRNCSATKKKH